MILNYYALIKIYVHSILGQRTRPADKVLKVLCVLTYRSDLFTSQIAENKSENMNLLCIFAIYIFLYVKFMPYTSESMNNGLTKSNDNIFA